MNDLSAWHASVETIRRLAEHTNATVVFGHDSEQLRSMRIAPEGYYD